MNIWLPGSFPVVGYEAHDFAPLHKASVVAADYDLAKGPVSYDFAIWLVKALMWKEDQGAERLHVNIHPHTGGLGGFARHWGGYDEAETRWRLWNIVLPLCQLAGATVTVLPERGEIKTTFDHHAREIIAASRAGRVIPMLSPSAQAVRFVDNWFGEDPARIVTITIRETNDPARNSSTAWWPFSDLLVEQKYRVVWIEDAGKELLLCPCNPVAPSVDLRAALYKRAAMNLMVCNGPAALCWYTGAPILQFGAGQGENWRKHYDFLGLKEGDQLPWARPDQRLIWKPDNFSTIASAFATWAQATS